MHWYLFYDDVALTAVHSTEDDQRLLDHLLAISQREMAATEADESTAFVRFRAPHGTA